MANLPTISIPDADVPRLRAALNDRMPGSAAEGLTDAQLYKRFVIATLKDVVESYERKTALAAAAAALLPAPDMS